MASRVYKMDPTDKFLRQVSARKLPVQIDCLMKLFTQHLQQVDINPQLVEQFDNVRMTCLQDNLTAVRKTLEGTPVTLLASMKSPGELCRATLRELQGSIECYLRGEATKFYPESSKEYRSLLFDKIATGLVQDHLTELFKDKELKRLLTKDLIKTVYLSSLPYFEGFTQAQFFSVEGNAVEVLRPIFIEKLELGIDLFTRESVCIKALKLIGVMRIDQICKHIEEEFNKELAECRSGLPMDSDLDPASDKGNTMYNICYRAWECRNQQMENFAEECLARCIDRNKYQTPWSGCHPSHVLACITRVFIGFINFRDTKTDTLCCHPEMYLWMRRLLQKLYNIPVVTDCFGKTSRTRSSHENRYLNALCKAVGNLLHENDMYLQSDETLLIPEERILSSDPIVFKSDLVRALQLNRTQSLILHLHIFDYIRESTGKDTGCEETKDCDVRRTELSWNVDLDSSPNRKESHPTKNKSEIGEIMNFATCVVQTVHKVLSHSGDMLTSARMSAKRAGEYLALLIIHKRYQNRFLSLLSFAVGTQVVISCLQKMGEYNLTHPDESVYVTDVLLILGAVRYREVQWNLVTSVVKGRFINVYSLDVSVLEYFFKMMNENLIGNRKVVHDRVENFDMTIIPQETWKKFQSEDLAAQELIRKIVKKLDLDP